MPRPVPTHPQPTERGRHTVTTAQRRILRMAAPLLGVALLASSCGGKSETSTDGETKTR